ncbi:YqaJ viral recombinase family protein [Streptomyces sp. Isolate_219]|uniref:YqaJ viral recombinase family nuclease n=1 Tax=Streptomyces sp. Isolate_219 TaxID=2950110 RepID=UPI0021C96A15|nr:YqaJ viral recombinase family protein [Streptomyces sp. Isolate_219]MCR8574731.1 YqaJ viral recombinase family protein [Streptomyces sp. Isolate_219]
MTDTALAGEKSPAAGPVVVGHFEPGSDEWHAARWRGIGGSEIAAVLGISPYESRFSLWHRKQGLIEPVAESEEMYWGKVHEPGICARFAELHPEHPLNVAPTYAAGARRWQIANPDRIWGPDLLEAKTARTADGWGEPGTDEIPVHYRAQCLQYLDVLQRRRCHLAVLIAGSEYREYVVEYDPAEAQILRDSGAEFMASLAAGARPDIDGHTATYQAIKALPDGIDDIDVPVTAGLRDEYFAALDTAKAAEEQKRRLAGLVLDQIGTGHRAVAAGRTVATRTVRDGRTHSLQPARNRSTA